MTPTWNQQLSCSEPSKQRNTLWNKLSGTAKRIKTQPVPNCSELTRNRVFRVFRPLVKEFGTPFEAGRRFTSLRRLPKRLRFRVARNGSSRVPLPQRESGVNAG
jgi:hypothetical protein